MNHEKGKGMKTMQEKVPFLVFHVVLGHLSLPNDVCEHDGDCSLQEKNVSLVTTSSKEIFCGKKRKISPLGFERLRGWYTVLLLQWWWWLLHWIFYGQQAS